MTDDYYLSLKSNEGPVIKAIGKNTRRTNEDEPLKMRCCGFRYQWLLGSSPGSSWVKRKRRFTQVKAQGFQSDDARRIHTGTL